VWAASRPPRSFSTTWSIVARTGWESVAALGRNWNLARKDVAQRTDKEWKRLQENFDMHWLLDAVSDVVNLRP